MEHKMMTLSQCSQYDKTIGASAKLTAWGKICAERAASNDSRSKRVKRNREAGWINKSKKS